MLCKLVFILSGILDASFNLILWSDCGVMVAMPSMASAVFVEKLGGR